MNPVHIDKYFGNAPAKQITVPGRLVDLASSILPTSALDSLATHGIDIRAISHALRTDEPYRCSLEVYEHGVRTTVTVSCGD